MRCSKLFFLRLFLLSVLGFFNFGMLATPAGADEVAASTGDAAAQPEDAAVPDNSVSDTPSGDEANSPSADQPPQSVSGRAGQSETNINAENRSNQVATDIANEENNTGNSDAAGSNTANDDSNSNDNNNSGDNNNSSADSGSNDQSQEQPAAGQGTTATQGEQGSEGVPHQQASPSPATESQAEENITPRPEISAIADQGGVLTPKGALVYENTLEYTNTTRNVFAFQGVEVSQVVLVGVVNANTTRNQLIQDTSRLRMGITNRLEADIGVPYVYGNNATSVTNTTTGLTQQASFEGHGIGDADAGIAYQINRGLDGWPYLVANLRYKSDLGKGPYDVPFSSTNIATQVPTGTGFQAAEGSLTIIKVSDPAVLFANVGYIANISRDIDKNFGTTRVTSVDPGDDVEGSFGMAFSVNQDTSFTLGYKHVHVFETSQNQIDLTSGAGSTVTSSSLEMGSFVGGISYSVSPRVSINLTMDVGATRDAPDLDMFIRIPVLLGVLY